MDSFGGRRVVVALAVLATVGLLGGYAVATRARPRPAKISLGQRDAESSTPSHRLYVHVAGAVRHPGLYRVVAGARVFDAIRAAGGPAKDADLDALNLAAKLKDGDKVLVPHKGTAAVPGANQPAASGGLVNLNTATVADLDTLPGIGPALAQRIIDYRTAHGGFRTVDELDNVSGIGPSKLDELRALVTV